MNVLGLFSGIGGFELGFQRAGFTIAAMCEIEPYAQSVLRRHWPDVPLYADVRELTGDRLRADGIRVDVITGGFPCQDISLAGKGAGLSGERSGLWREYLRVIAEVRPAWVVIENVSALRSRGLDTVLRQLAEIGYDAEWHCVPASAVGAPHRRDRVWIVAHPGCRLKQEPSDAKPLHIRGAGAARPASEIGRSSGDGVSRSVAHAVGAGLEGRARLAEYLAIQLAAAQRGGALPDTDCEPLGRLAEPRGQRGQWLVEPNVGRVANGVPARVDRLRSLGNAVVPQIPQAIAFAIRCWEFFDA